MNYSAQVSRNSHRIEAALRHAFLAELYGALWTIDPAHDLQVFLPEIDNSGYDVVLALGDVVRHVQLKSSMVGSTTQSVPVREALCRARGGCLVWCNYEVSSLDIVEYGFFGYTRDTEPLDFSCFPPARSTKANSQGVKHLRAGVRKLPKSAMLFELDIYRIIHLLFGIRRTPQESLPDKG
jgi:hypothetical protein